jgi:putative membrane protein
LTTPHIISFQKSLFMEKKKLILVMSIAAAIGLGACNKDDDNNDLNGSDRDFMVNASYGNVAEVDAGQLAASKGSTAGVRNFGQMMVNDHSTAQTELNSLGSQYNVSLPSAPDPAHQALKQQLMNLTGTAFDSTYLSAQVMDHQNTVILFQNEIANGNNSSIKAYATKYLPAIQMHLHMADSLRAVH